MFFNKLFPHILCLVLLATAISGCAKKQSIPDDAVPEKDTPTMAEQLNRHRAACFIVYEKTGEFGPRCASVIVPAYIKADMDKKREERQKYLKSLQGEDTSKKGE